MATRECCILRCCHNAAYTPTLSAPAYPQASGGWQVNGVWHFSMYVTMQLWQHLEHPFTYSSVRVVKAAASQVAFTAPPSISPSLTPLSQEFLPADLLHFLHSISSSSAASNSSLSPTYAIILLKSNTSINILPSDPLTTIIPLVSISTSMTLTSTSTTTTETSSPSASHDASSHLQVPILLAGILSTCAWLLDSAVLFHRAMYMEHQH